MAVRPLFEPQFTENDWTTKILPHLKQNSPPKKGFSFLSYIHDKLDRTVNASKYEYKYYDDRVLEMMKREVDSIGKLLTLLNVICKYPYILFLWLTDLKLLSVYPWKNVEYDMLQSGMSFRQAVQHHNTNHNINGVSQFITFRSATAWKKIDNIEDFDVSEWIVELSLFKRHEIMLGSTLQTLGDEGLPPTLKQLILYPSGRERGKMDFRPIDTQVVSSKHVIKARDIIIDHDPKNTLFPQKEYQGKQMIVTANEKGNNFIYVPVLRVVQTAAPNNLDAEVGLYKSDVDRKDDRCGTYYYYEPDSEFFLQGKTMLVATNKYAAINFLIKHPQTNEMKKFVKPPKSFKEINQDQAEFLERLRIAENEFRQRIEGRISEEETLFDEYGIDTVLDMYKHGTFPRDRFDGSMYDSEDCFDNLLCQLAVKSKMDMVLLTCMTGRNRFVAEVLDTRARKVSYESLAQDPFYHPHLNRTHGQRGYIEEDIWEEEEKSADADEDNNKVQCSHISPQTKQQCKRQVVCHHQKSKSSSVVCWQHG